MKKAFLIFGIIAAFIFFNHPVETFAGDPHFLSRLNVTNPKPPSVKSYAPGERIAFQVDFLWTYCSNRGGSFSEGRITNPVLQSRPHSSFSAWKRLATVHDQYTVKELNDLIKKKYGSMPTTVESIDYNGSVMSRGIYIPFSIKFKSSGGGRTGGGTGESAQAQNYVRNLIKGYPRDSVYTTTFNAPQTPGIYHFKYEVKVNTPQGDIVKGGVATFKVEKPLDCPPGTQKVIINGEEKCIPIENEIELICSADKSKVDVGETVTYTARSPRTVNFTWYNGDNLTGNVLSGPISGLSSSITRTFSEIGNYLTTVKATDSAGGIGICSIRTAVGDVEEWTDEETTEYEEFEEEILDEIVTEDGRILKFDRNAGDAVIKFETDRAITNDICVGTWEAENVLQCFLVQNGRLNKLQDEIEFSDSKELIPGNYQIQCLALKDGKPALSQERFCRTNPDFRES